MQIICSFLFVYSVFLTIWIWPYSYGFLFEKTWQGIIALILRNLSLLFLLFASFFYAKKIGND
jgi:hypothetical protein